MDTVNVTLTEEMQEFLRDEVEAGQYANVEEYIQKLIQDEQRKKAKERLEALLMEGINSGPAEEMTDEDWRDIRERLRRKWASHEPAR